MFKSPDQLHRVIAAAVSAFCMATASAWAQQHGSKPKAPQPPSQGQMMNMLDQFETGSSRFQKAQPQPRNQQNMRSARAMPPARGLPPGRSMPPTRAMPSLRAMPSMSGAPGNSQALNMLRSSMNGGGGQFMQQLKQRMSAMEAGGAGMAGGAAMGGMAGMGGMPGMGGGPGMGGMPGMGGGPGMGGMPGMGGGGGGDAQTAFFQKMMQGAKGASSGMGQSPFGGMGGGAPGGMGASPFGGMGRGAPGGMGASPFGGMGRGMPGGMGRMPAGMMGGMPAMGRPPANSGPAHLDGPQPIGSLGAPPMMPMSAPAQQPGQRAMLRKGPATAGGAKPASSASSMSDLERQMEEQYGH